MKILLVDDNHELRAASRELLEALGHAVVEAADGEGALALAEGSGEAFDVLVSDFSMPGIDGLELAARLRRERRTRGVLLVSSEARDPEIERRARELGAALRTKPFSSAELEAGLEEALAASPAPARRRPSPLAWGVPAAAVAAVVAGLVVLALDPGPPTLPAPVTEDVVRGTEVQGLAPAGPVAALPTELSWRPVADAAGYRVTLTEVDETVLWSAEALGARLALPAEVAGSIHPAVAYTWTVEALDAAGRRVAASRPTRFRVLPPRSQGGEEGSRG